MKCYVFLEPGETILTDAMRFEVFMAVGFYHNTVLHHKPEDPNLKFYTAFICILYFSWQIWFIHMLSSEPCQSV